MSHFNLKSLTFYGVMIGSVLLLFKIVSTYGENNLQAQPNIAGDYKIATQDLPECLRSNNVVLNVEQSGVFLFSKLLVTPKNVSSEENNSSIVSLDGKMNNGELSLSGKLSNLSDCQQQTNNSLIKIQGKKQDRMLSGTIAWNINDPGASFSAQLQEPPEEQTDKKH